MTLTLAIMLIVMDIVVIIESFVIGYYVFNGRKRLGRFPVYLNFEGHTVQVHYDGTISADEPWKLIYNGHRDYDLYFTSSTKAE